MPNTLSENLLLKYNHYRSIIEHENILLNHRMTWMWTLQGLLFTASSFFKKFLNGNFPVFLICIIGIFTCISISYSLNKSRRKLDSLHNDVEKLSNNSELENVIPVHYKNDSIFDFLYPWKFLPITFAFAWISLACYFFITSLD